MQIAQRYFSLLRSRSRCSRSGRSELEVVDALDRDDIDDSVGLCKVLKRVILLVLKHPVKAEELCDLRHIRFILVVAHGDILAVGALIEVVKAMFLKLYLSDAILPSTTIFFPR